MLTFVLSSLLSFTLSGKCNQPAIYEECGFSSDINKIVELNSFQFFPMLCLLESSKIRLLFIYTKKIYIERLKNRD